jgi:hypothetical protein
MIHKVSYIAALKKNISLKNQSNRLSSFSYIERSLENSYHGLIKENETFVEITPLIKVDEDKVCRLEILKSQKDIPFKASDGSFVWFFFHIKYF